MTEPPRPTSGEPPRQHDRLDDSQAILGEQSLQLPAERAEGPGLDLDQSARFIDRIDPKSRDPHLAAVVIARPRTDL